MNSFQSMWSLLSNRDRRSLRLAMAGNGVLAVMDMAGITMIFPLVLMMVGPSNPTSEAIPLPNFLHSIVQSQASIALLAGLIVLLFILRGVGSIMLIRRTLKVTLSAEALMAERLLVAFLSAPMTYHIKTNTASIHRTLGEGLRRVYQEGLVVVVPAVGDAVVVILASVALVVIAPVESLVGIASLALVVVIYRRATGYRTEYFGDQMMKRQEEAVKYINQSLGAVREIQLRGIVDRYAGELLRVRSEIAEHQRQVSLMEYLPRYLVELGMVLSASAVGATAFSRHPPETAIAILAMFVAAAIRLMPSLNRAMLAFTRLSLSLPSVALVKQALADLEPSLGAAPEDSMPMKVGQEFQTLSFDSVSYRYPSTSVDVLEHLDLTITKGEYVGIVGPSGSGKTTLLNVILGFLEPTNGSITINGVNMHQRLHSWRQRIGYVPQDIAFLDSSILDNVTLGMKGVPADVERVERCLEICQLAEFVNSLDDGLETQVREAGQRFSGGQRQRLGLARALYSNPEVLILDEATSALDPDTETLFLDAIDSLSGNLTVIVVAHRADTVARCRRIIALRP